MSARERRIRTGRMRVRHWTYLYMLRSRCAHSSSSDNPTSGVPGKENQRVVAQELLDAQRSRSERNRSGSKRIAVLSGCPGTYGGDTEFKVIHGDFTQLHSSAACRSDSRNGAHQTPPAFADSLPAGADRENAVEYVDLLVGNSWQPRRSSAIHIAISIMVLVAALFFLEMLAVSYSGS